MNQKYEHQFDHRRIEEKGLNNCVDKLVTLPTTNKSTSIVTLNMYPKQKKTWCFADGNTGKYKR